jgi:hypothetical protein
LLRVISAEGWNQFLASLQSLVDSGQGNPFTPEPATHA